LADDSFPLNSTLFIATLSILRVTKAKGLLLHLFLGAIRFSAANPNWTRIRHPDVSQPVNRNNE
jgi:hypothetical protein